MCDISKLLITFAQIIIEFQMRKRFIHTLWALLGTGVLATVIGFFAIWFGILVHARHRGFAESYQPFCHPGILLGWQGARYVEPEQGESYRDTL